MRLPAGTHGLASGISNGGNFHAKNILLPDNYALPAKHINIRLRMMMPAALTAYPP